MQNAYIHSRSEVNSKLCSVGREMERIRGSGGMRGKECVRAREPLLAPELCSVFVAGSLLLLQHAFSIFQAEAKTSGPHMLMLHEPYRQDRLEISSTTCRSKSLLVSLISYYQRPPFVLTPRAYCLGQNNPLVNEISFFLATKKQTRHLYSENFLFIFLNGTSLKNSTEYHHPFCLFFPMWVKM